MHQPTSILLTLVTRTVPIATVALGAGCTTVPLGFSNASVGDPQTIAARQNWEKCGERAAQDAIKSGSLQPAVELAKAGRRMCEPFEEAMIKAARWEHYRLDADNIVEKERAKFERVFVVRVLKARQQGEQ